MTYSIDFRRKVLDVKKKEGLTFERLGVSKNGIWWALKRMNVTYKKNSMSPESRRRETFFVS